MAKLIIAEDEPHMLRLLEMTLRKGGHEWTAVRDGRAALAAALANPPDLVILDVIMPELDGLDTLRALKADPITASVPVVMLTARGHSLTREEAARSGAALFLTKPFSPSELLASIATITGSPP